MTPEELQKLNDEFDALEAKISGLSGQLRTAFIPNITAATNQARDLTNSFSEGVDITKKLDSEMRKLKNAIDSSYNLEAKLNEELTKQLTSTRRGAAAKADNIRSQIIQIQNERNLNSELEYQLRQLEKANDAQKESEKALNEQVKSTLAFQKILPNAISSLLSIEGLFTAIVQSVLSINTQVTNLSRSLGISYESAKGIRDEMESFAKASSDGFTTVERLVKAQADLTEQLGIAVDFGNEERQQFSKLTELVGLSASEAGKLASFSASAGVSTSNYLKSVRSAAFASQQANKIHISDKQLLQSISALSAGILVKFQNNPKALAEAVVQAKKFGVTLEQIDKTGESLLDFESSIENELKAELLTGKQLNFERARAAALTGDQATLMQEMVSQAGSLEEFQNMNVIAQKSLAEAFGMSREEMADMLMKQEAINKYGDKAAELNAQQLADMEKQGLTVDEYLKKQAEQVSIQEKFNTAMIRLQEILGNLAAGPLGTILGFFADMLSHAESLSFILGGVMVMNLLKMITVLREAKKVSYASAVIEIISSAFKSVGGLPGVGMILAGGAAAAGIAYLATQSQKVEDGMAPPGKGPFTITDKFGATAVTAAGDGIAVSPNINKGGNTPDNSVLVSAINELRNAVNALANKPMPAVALNVSGQKLGEVVGRQPETGTNQYQNAYRLA